MDPRIRQLAKNLTAYSVALQKNDNILLDISGHDALPLAEALLEESYARGANPYLHLSEPRLTRAYLTGAAEEQMRQLAEFELARMKKMDAYIAVRAGDNSAELADVDQQQLACDSPIVLIDEIENAGIDKKKALHLLTGSRRARG